MDPFGRVTASTDTNGRSVSITYDALGRTTRVSQAGIGDTVTSYNHDPDNDGARRHVEAVTTRDVGAGTPRELACQRFDRAGRLASSTVQRILLPGPDATPTACETLYAYTAAEGWLDTVTDPENNTTLFLYYNSGARKSVVAPGQNAGQAPVTVYNDAGWVQSRTDGDGVGITYDYYPTGLLKEMTNAAGGKVAFSYDNEGHATGQTPNDGGRGVNYGYDGDGLNHSMTDVFNKTYLTAFQRDADANRWRFDTYQEGRASRRATSYLDNRGLTEKTASPLGDTLLTTRSDGVTLQASATRRGPAGVGFDLLDRAVAQYSPAGAQSAGYHARSGDLLTTGNPLGLTVTYVPDPTGDLDSSSDTLTPNGKTNVKVLRRDRNGRILSWKDAEDRVWSQTFLDGARKHVVTGPDGVATTTESTPGGRVKSRAVRGTDNVERTENYIHDVAGRLERVVDPSGRSRSMTYDSFGRLLSATEGSLKTSYSYDAATKQVAQIIAPGGRVTRFERDGYGRVWNLIDPELNVTSYGYEDDGDRVTRVDYPDGTHESFEYYGKSGDVEYYTDRGGRRAKLNYDLAGRVRDKSLLATGDTLNVEYNALNQVTAEIFNGARMGYEYLCPSQLTWKENFTLGGFGLLGHGGC